MIKCFCFIPHLVNKKYILKCQQVLLSAQISLPEKISLTNACHVKSNSSLVNIITHKQNMYKHQPYILLKVESHFIFIGGGYCIYISLYEPQ